MHFTVSSTELLRSIQTVLKVIPQKSSLSIVENALISLRENELELTGSDLQTTLKTVLPVENVEETGTGVIPVRILADYLKSLPDTPVEFSTEGKSDKLDIIWSNGTSHVPLYPAEDYPVTAALEESAQSVTLAAQTLLDGINSTIYAAGDEELRPIMNGICLDMTPTGLSFVASDTHKLVCFTRKDIKSADNSAFILHKRPAGIIRALLDAGDGDVKISYDAKSASFEFGSYKLMCRLIEGKYPAYRSVIPKGNSNIMTIERSILLNAVKRVSVFSNQSNLHIKFNLKQDKLTISTEDFDSNTSSVETLSCQYDGTPLEIGFKASLLCEILSNLSCDTVRFELADAVKASLILDAEATADKDEEITSLIMPIRM